MRHVTAFVLAWVCVPVAIAQQADGDISALYSKPSPFEPIPKEKWIAESENAFVIRDKYPQAPVHLLVIPKKRIPTLLQVQEPLLGEMLALARRACRAGRRCAGGLSHSDKHPSSRRPKCLSLPHSRSWWTANELASRMIFNLRLYRRVIRIARMQTPALARCSPQR
jgi:hypothetical protein